MEEPEKILKPQINDFSLAQHDHNSPKAGGPIIGLSGTAGVSEDESYSLLLMGA